MMIKFLKPAQATYHGTPSIFTNWFLLKNLHCHPTESLISSQTVRFAFSPFLPQRSLSLMEQMCWKFSPKLQLKFCLMSRHPDQRGLTDDSLGQICLCLLRCPTFNRLTYKLNNYITKMTKPTKLVIVTHHQSVCLMLSLCMRMT